LLRSYRLFYGPCCPLEGNVLEEPQYFPSIPLQSRVVLPIALDVPRELGRPIATIRLRNLTMIRAAVPETSVDEDGNFGAGEGHIWPDAPAVEPEQQVLPKTESTPMKL
jgi:hypothetical protein